MTNKLEKYRCVNKKERCGECIASNMCIEYKSISGENPFTMRRRTLEEFMYDILHKEDLK